MASLLGPDCEIASEEVQQSYKECVEAKTYEAFMEACKKFNEAVSQYNLLTGEESQSLVDKVMKLHEKWAKGQ